MNALDQIFGWLMIAGGVAQSVTNFRIQSSSHLTLSLSGAATAIIVSGFLNVSRARHSDGFTRAFSVIGNLLILMLAVGLVWPVRYHPLHNWQALGILVVTAIELLFALRG
jgi:Ca2+/H+ antiporter